LAVGKHETKKTVIEEHVSKTHFKNVFTQYDVTRTDEVLEICSLISRLEVGTAANGRDECD